MDNTTEAQKIMRRHEFPNWKDLLSIIAVFFLGAVISYLLIGLFGIPTDSGFGLFLSYTVQMSLAIIYSLYLVRRRTGSFKGLMRFSIHGLNPRLLLWGVILMTAVSIVIEPVINIFPKEYLEILSNTIINSGSWGLLTTIVMAAVLEEVLFRGIIQETLERKYGAWRAILIASLIFGVIHIIPQQVIAASCMGLVLGYIYYKTQSMMSVIIMHALNNALASLTAMFSDGSMETTKDLLGGGALYYAVYGAAAVLVLWSLSRVIVLIRNDKFNEIRLGKKKPVEEIEEEA